MTAPMTENELAYEEICRGMEKAAQSKGTVEPFGSVWERRRAAAYQACVKEGSRPQIPVRYRLGRARQSNVGKRK